ncbi:hypothetical protein N781_06045 [Pontibacillus halophilus JSM 076056 = DSM 19796]|uniref:DUF2627 domain-containing protein n=1 Tax=Pontibacillus halophilus JSM 076056 = DSM 19796 TaxID=1385510 RepID=A0A0A5I523_9BACI|nr:DUF2627 domain-containing protein [Pontibacillus halophilus]KGX90927.1 hypothetical protein N781_06045 [Pontibacillus halophilus JSM 076056 = DSM 19796]
MGRLIAVIMMMIPVMIAVLGVKLMRDTLFGIVHPLYGTLWIQGIASLIFFIIGLWLVGGFILHRDRKRNKTKGRFENK